MSKTHRDAYDISALSVEERVRIAAIAKTKVKAFDRGWDMLSAREIIVLAWFADLWLTDVELTETPPPAEVPVAISNL